MNFTDSSFEHFSTQVERSRGHSWITYLFLLSTLLADIENRGFDGTNDINEARRSSIFWTLLVQA